MENLAILNHSEICLQSLVTRQFLKKTDKGLLNCKGGHPSLSFLQE